MKCPGQDTRYWKPGDIFEGSCPQCGASIEFFKDDSSRRCRKCGTRVLNPRLDFGCAAYCKYAEHCLQELPPEIMARRTDLLKDRVAIEMKRYFDGDFKRIAHAVKVARYAEKIAKNEQADMAVVLIAAYLHDIGIKEAERRYHSSAACYQEELGPPVARKLLEQLGAAAEIVDEVCDIVGHHHSPRQQESANFKALYDADLIVNLEDNGRESPAERRKIDRIIDRSFLTTTGGNLAREVFQV